MMFDDITKLSHKLEDVFYYLRESKPQNVPHMELVEYVLKVSDFINEEMDKIENGDAADGNGYCVHQPTSCSGIAVAKYSISLTSRSLSQST